MKFYKSILFFALLSVFSNVAYSQADSVFWNNSNLPNSFYLKIKVGQGNQFVTIEENIHTDTVFIDYVFTDCSGPTTLYTWDSNFALTLVFNSSPYNLVARLVFDSNTNTNNNCAIHPRQYFTLYENYLPVGINDWAYNLSQHLKIWPNPIQNIGYLETTKGNIPSSIKIYNLQGQLLKTIATKSGIQKQEIDLRELKSGIYFIKTDTGMMKVLKE